MITPKREQVLLHMERMEAIDAALTDADLAGILPGGRTNLSRIGLPVPENPDMVDTQMGVVPVVGDEVELLAPYVDAVIEEAGIEEVPHSGVYRSYYRPTAFRVGSIYYDPLPED